MFNVIHVSYCLTSRSGQVVHFLTNIGNFHDLRPGELLGVVSYFFMVIKGGSYFLRAW